MDTSQNQSLNHEDEREDEREEPATGSLGRFPLTLTCDVSTADEHGNFPPFAE